MWIHNEIPSIILVDKNKSKNPITKIKQLEVLQEGRHLAQTTANLCPALSHSVRPCPPTLLVSAKWFVSLLIFLASFSTFSFRVISCD